MITEKQREERKRYIGSSDSPAILGVDPYRNAADVYYSKVGGAESPENEAMTLGSYLEPAVLDRFEKEFGLKLRRDEMRVAADGILCANHDALVIDRPEGVEAKTTGLVSGRPNEAYGEPGTDEVPESVIVQAHHQMIVSQLELVWVPVLIAGRGYQVYRVDRDNDLCQAIERRCVQFWREHVEPRVPPPDSIPSVEIIRRIRREPGKVTQIPSSVVEAWQAAKESVRAAMDEKDKAEAVLLTMLGDAEAGDCSLGRVTFTEQTRKSYMVDAAKYRVLRLKAAKRPELPAEEKVTV